MIQFPKTLKNLNLFGLVVSFLGMAAANAQDFGPQQTLQFDTTYTAAESGFVSASVRNGTCTGRSTTFLNQRLNAFVNGAETAREEDWDQERRLHLLIPVAKGATWRVDRFCDDGPGVVTFTPTTSDNAIGAYQAININQNYAFSTPGVVVASAYTGACRGPGSAFTHQNLSIGSLNQGFTIQEAAWGEWRGVSVTGMVRANESFRVNAFCNDAASAGLAFFVPLRGVTQAFTAPEARLVGTQYTAAEDGVVTANAWTGSCITSGFTHQRVDIVVNGVEVGSEQGWGEWRAQSVTVPVRRGNTYTVNSSCPSASNSVTFTATRFGSASAIPECRDGVDNDGDGSINGRVDFSGNPNTPLQSFGNGDPHWFTANLNARGLIASPRDAVLFDQATAQRICEVFGFSGVQSMSSLHTDGRNGFTSPGDNYLVRWNPTTRAFEFPNARDVGNRWLATLVCMGSVAECSNGSDDDRDGKIDFPADDGCFSAADGSESPQDTACSDGNDTSEREACRDGLDNDSDGLIDLVDPGCSSPSDDNEGDGTSQCQDGRDNDNDGAIDQLDFSCSDRTDNDETNPRSACQDGVDNDGDGLTDRADPGCSSNQDNNEADGTTQCQDGIDNDGDGAIDGADFSCNGAGDNDETNPRSACQDGLDNDSDALIDRNDPGCSSNQDNNEGDGTSQCQDGVDNDNDGSIDLADFSCSNPTDNDELNPRSACQDGLDNDSDGLVDRNDPGCAGNQDNNEGDGTSQCQDGIDNDRDGAIDFPADFSCASATDNNEGDPRSSCQDGLDNDNDGLTDLTDPGCSSSQDNNEGDGTSQCQDKLDNDGDGLFDSADPGCSSPQDNNEGDGTSACQDRIDNDRDGLVDLADPGCTNAQDNNEVDETARIQVSTECIYDNLDGTFTAYFGYESFLGAETTLVNDAARGVVNEFSPVQPTGSLLTTFKTGRQRGAVGIVFNGDPIVWTVQTAPGFRSTATASRASTVCAQVEPVGDCVDSNSAGLIATFGYVNPNPFPVRVSIGARNRFAIAPENRGQPTTFQSGTIRGAFTTQFSDVITWTLGNRTASVSRASTVCTGGCVGTSTTDIKSTIDQTAVKLAQLSRRASQFLLAQIKKSSGGSVSAELSRDVQRSNKRAEAFVKRANELALQFPEVVRSCPNAAQVCQSINRKPVIDELQVLYRVQVNAIRRFVNRGTFRGQGNTAGARTNPITVEARATLDAGLAAVQQLPVVATECK